MNEYCIRSGNIYISGCHILAHLYRTNTEYSIGWKRPCDRIRGAYENHANLSWDNQAGELTARWRTYLFAFGFTPLEPFDCHTAGLVVDARHDRRVDSSCNNRDGSSGFWHHTHSTLYSRDSQPVRREAFMWRMTMQNKARLYINLFKFVTKRHRLSFLRQIYIFLQDNNIITERIRFIINVTSIIIMQSK